jgi:hypothetical protein
VVAIRDLPTALEGRRAMNAAIQRCVGIPTGLVIAVALAQYARHGASAGLVDELVQRFAVGVVAMAAFELARHAWRARRERKRSLSDASR